jgi:hypothetical protein
MACMQDAGNPLHEDVKQSHFFTTLNASRGQNILDRETPNTHGTWHVNFRFKFSIYDAFSQNSKVLFNDRPDPDLSRGIETKSVRWLLFWLKRIVKVTIENVNIVQYLAFPGNKPLKFILQFSKLQSDNLFKQNIAIFSAVLNLDFIVWIGGYFLHFCWHLHQKMLTILSVTKPHL